MKISKVRGAKAAAVSKKSKKTQESGGQFVDQLIAPDAAVDTDIVQKNNSVRQVDSVLAIQEVADLADERSRAKYCSYGRDLLDRLDQVRLGLLAGVYSKESLTSLAQILRQNQTQTTDHRLNEIIKEIELRAEVEIAKLTRVPKRK